MIQPRTHVFEIIYASFCARENWLLQMTTFHFITGYNSNVQKLAAVAAGRAPLSSYGFRGIFLRDAFLVMDHFQHVSYIDVITILTCLYWH